MKFHLVTTTNKQGWEQHGRRMAQSVVNLWPDVAMPLTVYAEGFEPDVPGVETRSLPGWMADFKATHGGDPAKNGRTAKGYDFRFDAVKFAHKIAAVTDFGETLTDGAMIWLDADIYTHAPVTKEWLTKLFPSSAYLAWLDRRNSFPECGFVAYRCSHPHHAAMMAKLRDCYTSGNVFKLKEWHDCWVLQETVRAAVWNHQINPPASLSGRGFDTSHPFINGPLSACLDHAKGGRKAVGRSPKTERRIRDGNPYWT